MAAFEDASPSPGGGGNGETASAVDLLYIVMAGLARWVLFLSVVADVRRTFLRGRMIEGVSNLLEGKDTEGDGLDDMDAPQHARDRCACLPYPAPL